ncbi:MAG TPA: hypothetical protein VKU02_12255 [Gemmataceae bacterium]|nr:hypothetical protein [Gemmataceae bacterium]
MRRLLSWVVVAVAVCVLATGCGNGKLQTRGRVLKSGQPLLPREDESVRVTFVPMLPDGKPPSDHYFAEFNPGDATFWAAGKDKQGLPPGKYRVAVEYKKKKRDALGGKFDENRSPFVFEIDSRTPELVIDLDHPPHG